MKTGFLTKILVCRISETTLKDFANTARELRFKLICFRGEVFSVSEVCESNDSILPKALFYMDDLEEDWA